MRRIMGSVSTVVGKTSMEEGTPKDCVSSPERPSRDTESAATAKEEGRENTHVLTDPRLTEELEQLQLS